MRVGSDTGLTGAARAMGALAGCLALALGCIIQQSPEPVVAYPSSAASAHRPAPVARVADREKVLPSGLRVILDEDPNATAAGVVSVVRGGSGDDPPGQEGLAHLVEHLTYRAVDPPAAGERPLTRWDRLTRNAVAEMNGHTTPDCLLFYVLGPVSRLPALLQLESARLADPLVGVDEAAFALERRIIGSEHLVRADPRAGAWASMLLWPSLFPAGHPYARPTGGTEESRSKLTFADARAFAARAFVPDRTTLLVTAPPATITLAEIVAALPPSLREGAAAQPARADKPAPPPPAAPAEGAPLAATSAPAIRLHLDHRSSPLSRPELWLAWTLPGSFGDSAAMGQFLARWADDDLSAKDVVKEEHHIRQIATLLQPGVAASALFVRVLLADDADPERVAQVVVARVASLWARESSARETFAELKLLSETERLLDEPGQLTLALERAMRAALGSRSAAPPPSFSSAAVARLAYQWLTRDKVHATLFAPAPPATTHAGTLAAHHLPSGGAEPPDELIPGANGWKPDELRALLPANRSIAVRQLPSGLTVMTVRRPGVAAVAWLGFRGGTADADPPLLVEMSQRARPDARRAISLHIVPARGATRDLSFDAVEFPPAQLADALAILFAKATSPLKDWPDHDGLERLVSPIGAAEDAATQRAGQAFWHALLGDHPYASVVSADDLGKLTRSDVEAWLGRIHNVHNAALVVIGDVAPAEVERDAQVLSRGLTAATWIASPPAPAAPPLRPSSGARLRPVVTARMGALTDLRLGCLLPPMATADRGSYELLARAIEARLNTALRIEEGDGYGVKVSYERLRGGTTYLVAATFLADDGLGTALAALHRHWERWAREGLDPGELNVARWQYAGSLSAAASYPNVLAYQLLDDWNAEPASVGKVPLRPDVAALEATRANALFATCKANAVLGLTGNEALIRRALAEFWPGLATAAR